MKRTATHFGCRHPRDGNTYVRGDGYHICSLCRRIHVITAKVRREGERMAKPPRTIGERVMRSA